MNHLDDDAELYALGLTGSDRSAEIEAHLAACDECRARVVAAESVAASLAAALPPMPASAPVQTIAPRGRWLAPLATAAALVFAATAAFEGSAAHATSAQLATASTALASTNTALAALASSHFGHTTLTGKQHAVAKAIYARDGSWYYVIAEHVPAGSHVFVYHGETYRDLGALSTTEPATLFVRGEGLVTRIGVGAPDGIVATGTPVY
jgi:hypothetical protein